MNFMHCFISLVTPGLVLASRTTINEPDLYKRIDEGDVTIFEKMSVRDQPLWEKGVEHLVGAHDPAFVANFIAKAKLGNKPLSSHKTVLLTVFRKAPLETFERVMRDVKFAKRHISSVASYPEVLCSPEKYFMMLETVGNQLTLEPIIGPSTNVLHDKNLVHCIGPLLDAVHGRSFSELFAEDIFWNVIKKGNNLELTSQHIHHVAFTPAIYAKLMIDTWPFTPDHPTPLFSLLLQEADLKDIQAVLKSEAYKGLSPNFYAAIEKAADTISPDKIRRHAVASAKIARETFDDITGSSLGHQEPGDIIATYIVDEETEGRMTQTQPQKWDWATEEEGQEYEREEEDEVDEDGMGAGLINRLLALFGH